MVCSRTRRRSRPASAPLGLWSALWAGVLVFPAFAQPRVEAWVSSQDLHYRLSRQTALAFSPAQASALPGIRVDASRQRQTMLGLGSSLEPTTCANLSRLNPGQQEEVMERLVHPVNGIGMNLMRICMGTPDFTGDPWYSYDDMPAGQADPELQHFSIEKDHRYILPILKLARKKNPELLFVASPWSPPGWMKSTGDMIGGYLLPQYYEAYARYFVCFIQAYAQEGIPIHAVTIQNEPGVDRSKDPPQWRYPSCHYTGEQERDFIKRLGPALKKAGLQTRIWSYDHNFNETATPEEAGIDYPATVLRDPEAAAHVAGVGFHGYAGQPRGMSVFHERFPATPIHFTEGSVFGIRGALRLIDYLRNWASSYNAWVIMIDENRGPNNGPFQAGKTIVMLNSRDRSVEYRNDYYLYGQFMKFLQRAAVRIESDQPAKQFGSVAFRNPDGRIVLIVANAEKAREFRILFGHQAVTAKVPAESVATYVWKPE